MVAFLHVAYRTFAALSREVGRLCTAVGIGVERHRHLVFDVWLMGLRAPASAFCLQDCVIALQICP